MLPEGWRETTVGNCLSIMSGYAFKSDDFCDHGVPVIRISNITDMFDIDLSDCVYHNDMGKDFSYIAKMYDVLIAMSGATTGKIGIYKNSEIAYINQRVGKICINDSIANLKYFFYVLNQNYIQKYILKEAIGGAQPNISNRQISIIKINIPPLPEQEKIAAILSTWDKAISTTDALLAPSRQRKKALMQQLLTGKRRLPGFTGEWKFPRARKLFKNISIKHRPEETLLAVTQTEGVIPRHLLDRRVVMPDGDVNLYKLVKKGDFIISLRSFQGGLEYSSYQGLVSPAYTVITKCCDIDDMFYKHYFKSALFIGKLAVAVIGIRDGKQISYEDFSCIRLPYPPRDEQRAIAAVLDAADREIVLLEQKAARLREEKKALMQQLLTGKRRVRL